MKKRNSADRLKQIEVIIERVEARCMFGDGPVTNTRHEMLDSEMRAIWLLARSQNPRPRKRTRA